MSRDQDRDQDRNGDEDDSGALRDSGTVKEFVRRAHFDGDELVGARWWNESFTSFADGDNLFGRRQLLSEGMRQLLSFGGLVGVFGGAIICREADGCDDDDEVINTYDALDLQRRDGWSVGHAQRPLAFPGASPLDIKGSGAWRDRGGDLLSALSPRDPRLLPHANQTLFQAAAAPLNVSLRQALHPVHDAAMDQAFARGQALAALVSQPNAPTDLAVIVDLPGPASVAVAAALAPVLAPLFVFDNWPHPAGVVASHLTLGACLYYLPSFEEAARARHIPAPPVFVLDDNRLAPYRDQPDQFDNRYVAPLPSAASLATLGIKRILYVRPSSRDLTELDDLNADFVAFESAGLEVRAVGLDDFEEQRDFQGERPVAGTPAAAPLHGGGYAYGGHAGNHLIFWNTYGWSTNARDVTIRSRPPVPERLVQAARYRPVARPTLFSTRAFGGGSGIGKQKPSGFGRVSVRSGTTPGSGRSGSFGRSRSSYSS